MEGLQGLSTASDYGLKDINRLVELITTREVKAVFVESSVSEKAIKAVIEGCESRGHQLAIGGTLYSDAMGEAGTPTGEFTGMVRHNVSTIVQHLK